MTKRNLSWKLLWVLILLLCILAVPVSNAAAETETKEIDTANAVYLECALDSTAGMVSQAIQDQISFEEGGWDFCDVPFASPKMAVIIFPTGDQYDQLQNNLQAEGVEIAEAVAKLANTQWSEEYAELASEIAVDRSHGRTIKETDPVLVLLVYDRHMSLTCMDDQDSCTVFLMSDHTVSSSVDEAYIEKIARDLDISGDINQILYNDDDIAAIYSMDNPTALSYVLASITATGDTMRQMAPEALKSFTYGHDTNISMRTLISYYAKQQNKNGTPFLELMDDSRILAQEIMADVDEEWTWDGMNLDPMDYEDLPAMDVIVPFSKDKTILVISHSEDEPIMVDYSLESLLPAASIPDVEGDADQILLVDSKWEYQYTQNEIDIYACKTTLTLHDARSGEIIGVVGSSFNTLSGFTMVSGHTYKAPVNRKDIQQVITTWIYGGE